MLTSKCKICSLFLLIMFTLAGCEKATEGPDRFELSGKVTFNGKPVPVGEIVITPDTSFENKGPGSYAEIKDGQYVTAPGMGIVGGFYILKVTGFDGIPSDGPEGGEPLLQGKTLFSGHEIKLVLMEQNTTFDIEIPAEDESSKEKTE